MDVIVMAEGNTPTRLPRERTDRWSDEKQPGAALANARIVHHGPVARAVREVWNG